MCVCVCVCGQAGAGGRAGGAGGGGAPHVRDAGDQEGAGGPGGADYIYNNNIFIILSVIVYNISTNIQGWGARRGWWSRFYISVI